MLREFEVEGKSRVQDADANLGRHEYHHQRGGTWLDLGPENFEDNLAGLHYVNLQNIVHGQYQGKI